MSSFRKPPRLRPGDRVAIVSPSWGGPHRFPGIYELGLRELARVLEVVPVEYPTARMSPAELAANPETRAADVNAAFADPTIRGIIASIGGDDSVRILRHLDPAVIAANPKLLMGYSDFSTLLTHVNCLGNVTIHGPSVMAGLAQARALGPAWEDNLRRLLLDNPPSYEYRPYPRYSSGYPDWSRPEDLGKLNAQLPAPGWDWVQGGSPRTAPVWGGCIEVLEMMKATPWWPPPSFFDDKILFLETSEDMPPPQWVLYWLRNYGVQTVLDRIQGLVMGRPHGYTDSQRRELRDAVIQVVIREFGRSDLTIVLDFDAGHTDPQHLVPFGVLTRLDPQERTIGLVEPVFDDAPGYR